jgi:hypothetical protein
MYFRPENFQGISNPIIFDARVVEMLYYENLTLIREMKVIDSAASLLDAQFQSLKSEYASLNTLHQLLQYKFKEMEEELCRIKQTSKTE